MSAEGEPSARAAVTIDNVSFEYRQKLVALDRLWLSIGQGVHTGIVGPSGCGKSTLLSLLAGIQRPTRGSVTWKAAPPDVHPLSMVFQDDTLLPWLSVAENVGLCFKFRGRYSRRDVQGQIAHLLRLGGLEAFASAYPYQLSGGMKRRVAFLAAVAPMPAALLLDEPFSSLDEPTRVTIHQDVLKIMRTLDMTVVLVTHDLAEAISLCDEVVILTNRPGRVATRRSIPFGRDRDVFQLRRTPEFLQLYAELWDELSKQILSTRSSSDTPVPVQQAIAR